MIQKKVCMIGASGVGKTSLVAKFVHSIFSEKYLTTVGVKIDKKAVQVGPEEVTLLIWDLSGDDDFQRLQTSYLRGTSGYLLVADGTRRATFEQVQEIQTRVSQVLPKAPFILALNKADLAPQWEVTESDLARLGGDQWVTIRTSAKVGSGVEEAFGELARMMLAAREAV